MTVSNPNTIPIIPLWINGTAIPSSQGDILIPITHGASNTHTHNAHSATRSHATSACVAASEALVTWRKTSIAHRRALLLRAADVIERRAQELMDAQVGETSCPMGFAGINVRGGVANLREIAAATSGLQGKVVQRVGDTDGIEMKGLTVVVREAVGVVVVIAPWNGAVILPLRGITQALGAGCTVVLKASELCPKTHHLLVSCLEEAGVPAGVVNVIQASRDTAAEITETLVAHPAVRKVDFIGSAAVGKEIGRMCARHLKPILMELGGKGPALVLDDADVEKAAFLCAMGAMADHGQLCFSTERIILHSSIAPSFLSALEAAIARLPPTGSAVTRQSAEHAHELLVDAESKGAEFLVGGPEYLSPTRLAPTILLNVPRDARIRDEETFGPSACVYVVESDDEAVELANESVYGLSCAVHSRSWERAYGIARRLEYGQVHVNAMTTGDSPNAPICGVKGSGWGQSNSLYGIEEFSVEKTLYFESDAMAMFRS